jgi:hypothetical protein
MSFVLGLLEAWIRTLARAESLALSPGEDAAAGSGAAALAATIDPRGALEARRMQRTAAPRLAQVAWDAVRARCTGFLMILKDRVQGVA